ncbi:Anti-sigma regulatory factor (Ser/Thr protein kinase) [Caminicella sporogenes DSM 14501]|uniref:Anti-sigma regulatory factor (Ser/Thr protein kinase) n=1 Tax=Caminicella sporogenes DSM 14501 TaxID=1121266 RepID=A0A1M6LXU5_9FIRM|nr:anti-sigma regulatory factor [Caminicella sporogenes]RKD27992.1 anti-sigma regulatory factor [Caminicella sporogenes]WIF94405.1 anti-sigma regulatory factor [Caminicella sporogenes]SHJ76039.1 Anti-sigma regulatory factor (Ser/Thr protein kinase) [Caminicella sporogenes DSM 14501]
MESEKKASGIKLEYNILKDDFSRAGEASSSIKKVLRQLGIDSNIIRRVAIATYEAEINIVIHSEGGNIIVYIMPDRIEIIAKDNGPGIENIELAMQEGFSTASNRVRELGFGAGMGLPNMKKSSDEFVIESKLGHGTTVKMTMYL